MCYGCQKGFHFLCLNQWYQRPSILPTRSSRVSITSTSRSSSTSSSHLHSNLRRLSSPSPASFSSSRLSLEDIKDPFYCSEVCRHRTVESFCIENEAPPTPNPLSCVSLPPPDRSHTRKRKRTPSSPPSSSSSSSSSSSVITTTMITPSSSTKSLPTKRKSTHPSTSLPLYRLSK